MPAPALLFALSLMASDPAPTPDAEPLPPGAPTQAYPLAAWCYGALSEYLDVYERVKPDLRAIDKMFGSSVPNEKEPYAHDMAAARIELKKIGGAVQAAEEASPTPIAPQGVAAIDQGRAIWRPAELKTRRELARAWLTWALPDRCASNAKELAASSSLLGQALKYNTPSATDAPAPPAPEPAPDAPTPASTTPSPPAPEPAAAPSEATAPSGPPPIGGYNSYLNKPATGAASSDTPSPAANTPAPPAADAPITPTAPPPGG
jgi:hypothetical protein